MPRKTHKPAKQKRRRTIPKIDGRKKVARRMKKPFVADPVRVVAL